MITPPRSALATALTLTLLALGLTLFVAPTSHTRRVLEQLRASRAQADGLYHAGRRGVLSLQIPQGESLGREAVLSAATSLGRQALEHRSPHLDVPTTVDHTARAAGRVVPHHLPALGGPPLLVWVDVERGDHPLLWSVEAVFERWTKEGLPFVRLNYAYSPELLTDPVTGRRWALGDVGRRYAGAPLLMLSRLSSPQGFYGERDWPRHLSPWPRRALIDLNPLHKAPRWLHRAGLAWFPYTDDGLKAAATLLARGERLGPTLAPPKLPSVSALAEPLRRWTIAAACAPNPTWPQLEALRVGIPTLRRDLPDHRLVQHLIEHLRPPGGGEPCADDGESLILPRRDMAALLAAQRGLDGRPSALEEAALRLLIQQLNEAQPEKDTLAEWRKRLRVACYELTLGERSVEEVHQEFAESPVRDELERRLAQEDRVRQAAGVGRGERLVEGLSAEGPLSLLEVATAWARVSGRRQLVGVMALGVLGLSVARLGSPREVVSLVREVELPEEWKVERPEAEQPGVTKPTPVPNPPPGEPPAPVPPPAQPLNPTPTVTIVPDPPKEPNHDLRPALRRIPGGSFLMGSPDGALTWEGERQAYESERPQHTMEISPFQMCQTEVTQRQYSAVMGENPSKCGIGCGDTLPVHDVSWFEAVQYLNQLTRLESERLVASGKGALSTCYTIDGAVVEWAKDCTGYRLPTEAEWEYTARAGTTTSWSFGDDPTLIEAYAWYDKNSVNSVHTVGAKKANPWGLYDTYGNVWEWVWDTYRPYERRNLLKTNGGDRTLRGGSFKDPPRDQRSAARNQLILKPLVGNVGFRCARSASP